MARREAGYLVTEVAAERQLEFVAGDGRVHRVSVRIGRPRRDRKHPNGDWVCPYDISGVSGRYRRWAYGIDGMQALNLAYHIIPVELTRLAKQAGGGQYRFLGEEGIGFADGCGLLVSDLVDRTVSTRSRAGMKARKVRRKRE
jgi:hypothetical protein